PAQQCSNTIATALKLRIGIERRKRGCRRLREATQETLAATITKLCFVSGLLPAFGTRNHFLVNRAPLVLGQNAPPKICRQNSGHSAFVLDTLASSSVA